MPKDRVPPDFGLPDDRVLRLGAEWYADIRRQNDLREAEDRKRRDATAEGGDGGLLDWLFGGDGDGDAGDGGD